MRVVATEKEDDRVIMVVQAQHQKLRLSISIEDARRLHAFRLNGRQFSGVYTSEGKKETGADSALTRSISVGSSE